MGLVQAGGGGKAAALGRKALRQGWMVLELWILLQNRLGQAAGLLQHGAIVTEAG
jgi:K+ transporter